MSVFIYRSTGEWKQLVIQTAEWTTRGNGYACP